MIIMNDNARLSKNSDRVYCQNELVAMNMLTQLGIHVMEFVRETHL